MGVSVVGALAALVPRPSVPPGAGNEAKKARKAELKRVEKRANGYVETGGLDRHLDTATIRRHDDGDGPAVPRILIEQHDLRVALPASRQPAVSGQSIRDHPCVNHTRSSGPRDAAVTSPATVRRRPGVPPDGT